MLLRATPSSLGSWVALNPMQRGRNSVRAVSLDGFIYVLGGKDSTATSSAEVDTLNPQNNQLSVAVSAPFAMAASCVAVDEAAHVVYVAGDTDGHLLTMSAVAFSTAHRAVSTPHRGCRASLDEH